MILTNLGYGHIIIGTFLITISFIVECQNTQSKILLKIIPFFSGLFLLYSAGYLLDLF